MMIPSFSIRNNSFSLETLIELGRVRTKRDINLRRGSLGKEQMCLEIFDRAYNRMLNFDSFFRYMVVSNEIIIIIIKF